MASLCLCPSPPPSTLSPIRSGNSVNFSAALRPSRLCPSRKFLSQHVFRWMQLQTDFRTTLCLAVHTCFSISPLMSIKNGYSANTCKDLCTVIWSIEADVADGYIIFVTGDPVSLGCWEPAMAVLLSPSSERDNVWMTEIKVPCGIQFKYNYFMKEEKQPFRNHVWRPGPEFSLSIPFISKETEVIVVRDSWMRNRIHKLPVPSWGSWMMDADTCDLHLKQDGHRATSAGEHKVLKSVNGAATATVGETLSVDHTTMVTSSWINGTPKPEEKLSERDQPVEEPWLIRSTLVPVIEINELKELSDEGEVRSIELPENLHRVAESLATEDEHKPVHAEEPTSTVILINSSVCTMQRIAILEDGKLVELLLEPVKNNVQCDSIYLGVVTKLVPHMGGAFVDIGISRPSLMGIKQNREPFVFPPFSHAGKETIIDGSTNTKPNVQFDVQEHDQSSCDNTNSIDDLLEVDHQDDSLQFIHEDIGEKEIEDDTYISNGQNMRENSDANDNDGDDDDSEEYHEENGDQMDFLPQEAESSNGLDLPLSLLQDLKDTDDIHSDDNKWSHVRKGTKVIVQVVKEGLGTKGPALTAYPNLRSRFWILTARCNRIGVSKKITGGERTRLRDIAKALQPSGFGLTVRTVAAGHSLKELQKDLDGLLSTWKGIVEHAKSAALAAEEGVEGAVPVMLHRAMGQTLSVVQDDFNEKVDRMVVDSPRTFHEVTRYLQEIAPDLCYRVELHDKRTPIFDEYNIEEEINNILSKRVPLLNGGSLVIEQTEALVSVDVNGGHGMLGQGTSQEEKVLEVNLAAAKQIARELRLRDIGGIIVVDFIDMADESNKRLVYEEMKKAVERDRSMVRVSELSKNGLMEITRKRVRPSVTFMISEPCTCCNATGRIEALETSFSKIEHEFCRLLAALDRKPDHENAKSWPRFVLRVDRYMCNYLTSGKRTKLAVLSSSLKVWILLKVARGFPRGTFEVKPFTEENSNDDQQVAISRFPNTKLTLFPVKTRKSRGK